MKFKNFLYALTAGLLLQVAAMSSASAQTALDFDGVNQSVNITNPSLPNLTNRWSMSAWINWSGTGGGYQVVMSRPRAVGGTGIVLVVVNNDGHTDHGHLFGGANNGAGFNGGAYDSVGSISPGVWTHIAYTYDNNSLRIYLNGGLIATSSAPNLTLSPTNEPLFIAREATNLSTRIFSGAIDEVTVWNTGLSQAGVEATMGCGLTGNEAGLLAYYKFEDGTGSSTLTDLTANQNDGSLTNMDPATDWVSSPICNTAPIDIDGDGVPDSTDFCPTDATNDADDDGICGGVDNCPAVANTDQTDTDGDGVGDACNEGDDNDGDDWNNELDNCPAIANLTQADADMDGTGDACDSCPIDAANDADGDGVCGDIDNCPVTPNSDQADSPDADGIGNACDDDDDNDGTLDSVDNCPLTYNDQADYDNDGQGDACDDDVDGDNVNDADDACLNTAVGALVNSTGCAVAQLCPCDGNWKNHGAYVKCVAHTANDFRDAGLISDSEHGEIVSAAAQSSCGSKK